MVNSFNFYPTILDNLPLGVCVYDADGNFLYVNSMMVNWRKITLQQYLRMNVHDFYGSSMISNCVFDLVIEQKRQVSRIQHYRNRDPADKTERLRIVTGVPIFRKDGDIQNVITFLQDVNDFNNLYHELEYHQSMIPSPRMDIMPAMSHDRRIIAESPAMKHLLEAAAMIAKTDSTVLLYGESGAGKEVVAHYIRDHCGRKNKPFIEVNCAAFTESLLESELFGYEKGTFTGALKSGKPGLVEAADGGTLFLDEINSLPLGIQGKFLKLIDEKQNRRIGSECSKKIDFRLITATNVDLWTLVQQGSFRTDLYYRLNVVPLTIPPLRERPEDISALSKFFISVFSEQYGMKKQFSAHALHTLENYSWPGNVRELRNLVERIVIMTPHDIGVIEKIPNEMLDQNAHPSTQDTAKAPTSTLTKEKIEAALKLCNGNREQTARYLGISRRTLQYRIQEFKLPCKKGRS